MLKRLLVTLGFTIAALLPAVIPASAASCVQGAAGCSITTGIQGCSSVDSQCR